MIGGGGGGVENERGNFVGVPGPFHSTMGGWPIRIEVGDTDGE